MEKGKLIDIPCVQFRKQMETIEITMIPLMTVTWHNVIHLVREHDDDDDNTMYRIVNIISQVCWKKMDDCVQLSDPTDAFNTKTRKESST